MFASVRLLSMGICGKQEPSQNAGEEYIYLASLAVRQQSIWIIPHHNHCSAIRTNRCVLQHHNTAFVMLSCER